MNLPLLRAENLTRAGFSHGFTTRHGGVSTGPYASFDFAMLRDPEGLAENHRRLAAELGAAGLSQATQVHGRRVVKAGLPSAEEADALVAEPGEAVLVRVADCVPVLVAEPSTGRAAAIHAGWRGIELGVVTETLGHFSGPLVAAIGPSIGPCCFEVGEDVAERLRAAARVDVVDRASGPGKVFVDLRRAVRAQLVGADVEDVPGCTRCDAERFYSYRRDGDLAGRLVGAIRAGRPPDPRGARP